MIKYLVMDVDGTLTDGKINMSSSGELFKSFCIKDGLGLRNLVLKTEVVPIIITGRDSKIVENRCAELGISHLFQGVSDKLSLLKTIIDDIGCVAYIGDDVNDLECMMAIKSAGGIVGCPSDAVNEVIEISDFVSVNNGGNGAVRDFIEFLVKEVL